MYKVGDEVLVKATVEKVADDYVRIYAEGFGERNFSLEYAPIEQKTYTQGLADAWELAKRLYAFEPDEREKMLGYQSMKAILEDLTPEYVMDKIEAYEKGKEIKVGNEVRCGNVYGVVTYSKNGYASVMWKDGSIGDECECKDLTKTGTHIDIESLLRQIGE